MKQRFETVQELLELVGRRGEAPCLAWFGETEADGLSCAAFAEQVRRAARGLRARGIGPGARAAVFAENRWQIAMLAVAIIASGAAVVPLDPQLSGETLAHVLGDAAPALLLATAPQEEAARRAMGTLDLPVLLTDLDAGPRSWRALLLPDGPEPDRVGPNDPAALFYTSGSTGMPKGAPLSHANLVFQQRALIASGLTTPEDRLLLPLPLHHVYPFVVGLLTPLALGVCVIFPRAASGADLLRAAGEGRATILAGVPRLYEVLAAAVMGRLRGLNFLPRQAALAVFNLCLLARRRLGLRLGDVLLAGLRRRIGPKLRILASGGAPLEPELAWTLEALGFKVAIGYGLTETSPILCLNPPGAGRFETVGPPLPGVSLRVAPTGHGRADGFGEVQARGAGVFAGYRNLPERTREAFTEDGWFRTGDLGRLVEGRLELGGRASTLIVARSGENVQPETVERVLDRHPLLLETGALASQGKIAVLVRPDPAAARNAGLSPEEAARLGVREASQALPSHQRPSLTAVTRTPLERTRLGKLRRHKLAERFEAVMAGQAVEDLAPMPLGEMGTEDRRLLENDAAAAAWTLLAARYPKSRLSPDSDMAGDLGVDSLEWLDLSLALGRATQSELDEERLAAVRTARDLLRLVAEPGGGRERPDPIRDPEGYLRPEDLALLTPASGGRLALYRVLHAALGGLIRAFFRIRLTGIEGLPQGVPLVFTPNHASYLDPIVLGAALPFSLLRRTHFIAWRGAAFGNRLLAFLSRTAQAVPIDPEGRPGTSLALGAAILGRGRDLVWFPEGMRSRDGRLVRFQPGLGRILAHSPAAVVPVRIEGARQALAPGEWRVRPAKVTIVLGEPMLPDELRRGEAAESQAERIMRNLRARMEVMEKQGA